jgi:carbon storage regulator
VPAVHTDSQKSETVMIGNDVTTTVPGAKGNQVRTGINAPKNVAVHRKQIFELIKKEQQAGAPRKTNPSLEIVQQWVR